MHTIRWRGRIAYLGIPTVDGRVISSTVTLPVLRPATVYWLRPLAGGGGTPEILGKLTWAWTQGVSEKSATLYGAIDLYLDKLPRPHETLWPEVDITPWTGTILGVCLGTTPAWYNLDPVISV